MNDKQIIELFWDRSDDARNETSQKYGWLCEYLVYHILENQEAANRCIKECYDILWESIPPRRPQNLKAFLCKVTRNHTLYLKYPDREDCEKNLLTAEFMVQEFVKNLNLQERKVFVARYWFFASVSEISTQYKMNEQKVEETLHSLYEKLNYELGQKCGEPLTEVQLLYAMTEIDDIYLEEAEPMKQMDVENCEETKAALPFNLNKKTILVITCGILLVVFLLVGAILISKFSNGQPPKDTQVMDFSGEEIVTETHPGEQIQDLVCIIKNDGELYLKQSDFEMIKQTMPWDEGMEIAALPVYKNLSTEKGLGWAYSEEENNLLVKIEEIAQKMDWEVSRDYIAIKHSSVESGTYISGVSAMADKGLIQILQNGNISISFKQAVQLPYGYRMSNSATREEATVTVSYLLKTYADLFHAEHWTPVCYATYDADGNRTMNYYAFYWNLSLDGILNCSYNWLHFKYKEGEGLTEIYYSDALSTAEIQEHYPVLPLETAYVFLKDGSYETDVKPSDLKELEITKDIVDSVELVYKNDSDREYYEPYYCFYVQLKNENTFGKFYVSAALKEEEDCLANIQILDMQEYDGVPGIENFVYHKDGKYFALKDGVIKQVEKVNTRGYSDVYGETFIDYTEDMKIEKIRFFHDGKTWDFTEELKDVPGETIIMIYVDGKIIIRCERVTETDIRLICYVYSTEDQSLKLVAYEMKMSLTGNAPDSIHYYGRQYATRVDEKGELVIMNLLDATQITTHIANEDVRQVVDTEEDHFVMIYHTGDIAIVDIKTGETIKKAYYPIDFFVSACKYDEDKLYLETSAGKRLVFILPVYEP